MLRILNIVLVLMVLAAAFTLYSLVIGTLAAQDALLDVLRSKIRPLALALGCCPECVVGVEHCPKCDGQSRVGLFEPDRKLLRALVVNPLIERGIPLSASETQRMRSSPRSQNDSETNKRRKS